VTSWNSVLLTSEQSQRDYSRRINACPNADANAAASQRENDIRALVCALRNPFAQKLNEVIDNVLVPDWQWLTDDERFLRLFHCDLDSILKSREAPPKLVRAVL